MEPNTKLRKRRKFHPFVSFSRSCLIFVWVTINDFSIKDRCLDYVNLWYQETRRTNERVFTGVVPHYHYFSNYYSSENFTFFVIIVSTFWSCTETVTFPVLSSDEPIRQGRRGVTRFSILDVQSPICHLILPKRTPRLHRRLTKGSLTCHPFLTHFTLLSTRRIPVLKKR